MPFGNGPQGFDSSQDGYPFQPVVYRNECRAELLEVEEMLTDQRDVYVDLTKPHCVNAPG